MDIITAVHSNPYHHDYFHKVDGTTTSMRASEGHSFHLIEPPGTNTFLVVIDSL